MAHGELACLFLEVDTGFDTWTTVRESYSRALEQGPLLPNLQSKLLGERGSVLVLHGPRDRGDEEPPVCVVLAVVVVPAAAALDQLRRSQIQFCRNNVAKSYLLCSGACYKK